MTCDTDHPVTNGGVGDFSVILDRNADPASHHPYIHLLELRRRSRGTGHFVRPHAVKKQRDRPFDRFSGQSQVSKWDGSGWHAPGIGGRSEAIFHDSRQVSWTSAQNNGYWGAVRALEQRSPEVRRVDG